MKRHLSTAGYVLAFLGLVWLARECGYREGGKDAILRQQGVVWDSSARETDRLRADMIAREVERESTLARTGRELHAARTEVTRLKARIVPISGAIVPDSVTAQFAVRDSVIYAQSDIIRQQDTQLTIWRALAEERGTLLLRALSERDQYREQSRAWERKAQRRVSCGPGLMVTPGTTLPIGFACVIRL